MQTFVLFIYLATWSANGGMTTTTQEFSNMQKCQSSGALVEKNFGGIYTRVFHFCVEK